MKLPSFSQWEKLPSILSRREKFIALALVFCFLGSGIFLLGALGKAHTQSVPARGGSLKEGVVGSPHFINPIFADANDVDRDLTQLTFAGLVDLAKNTEVSDDGKTVDITLKDNLKWSDGEPITADDVVFTIGTFQDPRYKSPVRANWVGVRIEKISTLQVRFILDQSYAPFVERLKVQIIPSHIWEQINAENFALSLYNIQPVGSGPYRVKNVKRDSSGSVTHIELAPNRFYGKEQPFLQSITFVFFGTEEQMLSAAKLGQIESFAPANLQVFPSFRAYQFSLPRYFALFFNLGAPQNNAVRQKTIRQALALTTNKQELVQKLFGNKGTTADSPFLPEMFGFSAPSAAAPQTNNDMLALLQKAGYTTQNGKIVKISSPSGGLQSDLAVGSKGPEVEKLQSCLAKDPQVYPDGTVSGRFGEQTRKAVIAFQEKYASEILTPQGLTSGTGKIAGATRDKLNALCFQDSAGAQPLSLVISTVDQYPLKDAAKILKQQWEKAGFSVTVDAKNASELERDVIKPRNYQILLFGEILGTIPDPFPFWHSSQIKDPGLNLSSYSNKTLDALLEKARKELDPAKRNNLYSQMQDALLKDTPLITLYNTPYLYEISPKIKGIETTLITDPSQRFSEITHWYTHTKRVWK